ncbi:hypothetical protein EfsSVR2281_07560 [Enterococcus faecalis]|nr:hypothetical protein EfsSVR2281_07560 [Enterococcus faecalis]
MTLFTITSLTAPDMSQITSTIFSIAGNTTVFIVLNADLKISIALGTTAVKISAKVIDHVLNTPANFVNIIDT